MRGIWKGLIGLGILLLGLALWIAGSVFEGLAGGLAGESFLLTRGVMGIGFFLIFFGPIFFWIILPLKDRWYESHPKRFIVALIPFVLFLLLIFGAVISYIIHEPQLPTYSFNTTVEGNKLIVDIQRISSGDLPDRLTIRLLNPDGEQVDFDFVPDSDLKDGKEQVELSMAYFGAPKADNYTLVIENVRDKVIYRKEISAPKFGEVPYLIIKDSFILPSNKVEEWHKMEIINYTMKVEEGWVNKYEIDIDIWIRNTYNLPVDWIEVDVEFINEWNQTYIETDIWSQFIRPNETAMTYIHTAGEYIPQIKEIHVWGHEHHP
ncbi:MAG: hypothetical protein N2V73_01160 [Candidatus Methanospirare jalkutatii]|nr:hypothetical protein [Candidatus Methanospirare jalkutatii]